MLAIVIALGALDTFGTELLGGGYDCRLSVALWFLGERSVLADSGHGPPPDLRLLNPAGVPEQELAPIVTHPAAGSSRSGHREPLSNQRTGVRHCEGHRS